MESPPREREALQYELRSVQGELYNVHVPEINWRHEEPVLPGDSLFTAADSVAWSPATSDAVEGWLGEMNSQDREIESGLSPFTIWGRFS